MTKITTAKFYKLQTSDNPMDCIWVTEGRLHDFDGKVIARSNWASTIAKDMPSEMGDGEVLDELINLIDEGVCNG